MGTGAIESAVATAYFSPLAGYALVRSETGEVWRVAGMSALERGSEFDIGHLLGTFADVYTIEGSPFLMEDARRLLEEAVAEDRVVRFALAAFDPEHTPAARARAAAAAERRLADGRMRDFLCRRLLSRLATPHLEALISWRGDLPSSRYRVLHEVIEVVDRNSQRAKETRLAFEAEMAVFDLASQKEAHDFAFQHDLIGVMLLEASTESDAYIEAFQRAPRIVAQWMEHARCNLASRPVAISSWPPPPMVSRRTLDQVLKNPGLYGLDTRHVLVDYRTARQKQLYRLVCECIRNVTRVELLDRSKVIGDRRQDLAALATSLVEDGWISGVMVARANGRGTDIASPGADAVARPLALASNRVGSLPSVTLIDCDVFLFASRLTDAHWLKTPADHALEMPLALFAHVGAPADLAKLARAARRRQIPSDAFSLFHKMPAALQRKDTEWSRSVSSVDYEWHIEARSDEELLESAVGGFDIVESLLDLLKDFVGLIAPTPRQRSLSLRLPRTAGRR